MERTTNIFRVRKERRGFENHLQIERTKFNQRSEDVRANNLRLRKELHRRTHLPAEDKIVLITVIKNGATEKCQNKDIIQSIGQMTSKYSLEACRKKSQDDRLKYDKVVVEGIPFSTIFLNHS